MSPQQPASTATLREEADFGANRRRQCISLDENAIQRCYGRGDGSQGALSSGEHSPQRRFEQFLEPGQPPFPPPERVKTPEGIPTWRGEILTTVGSRVSPVTSTTHTLFRQLRARSSQVLGQIFGGQSARRTPQSRTWRPPVSGQRWQTFGRLESHPFTTAPVASSSNDSFREVQQNEDQKSPVLHTRRRVQRIREGNVPMDEIETLQERHVSHTECDNTVTSARVQSPSQRALQAVSGNAILVPPQRARKYAQASNSARSISMPSAHASQVNTRNTSSSRPLSTPNGTMNTTELIQQFPQPPNQPSRSRLPAAGAYRTVFSVFPPYQEPGNNERAVLGGFRHLSGRGGKSRVQSNDHLVPTADTDRRGMQQELRSCTLQLLPTSDAASNCGMKRSFVTAVPVHSNEPSVRGKSLCRYRHSGTPVYDNDASSLRSFDDQRERDGNDLLTPRVSSLPRPSSAFTGSSRYFSAASTSIRTRIVSQRLASGQEQERAVANGALRFVGGRNEVQDELTASASVVSPSPPRVDENSFPMTAVTVTQASKSYCRHRLKRMQVEEGRRPDRLGLDGSPAPPDQETPLDTQPADPNQVNRPAELQFQPSQESFGHRHHISRRIKSGTWRTRMDKTKCWRCEIESRRRASRVALHRKYRYCINGWSENWLRFKEKLKWTCFCRYRAYDEDSDDPIEVEHRARLGRFGGTLSQARRF